MSKLIEMKEIIKKHPELNRYHIGYGRQTGIFRQPKITSNVGEFKGTWFDTYNIDDDIKRLLNSIRARAENKKKKKGKSRAEINKMNKQNRLRRENLFDAIPDNYKLANKLLNERLKAYG